MNDNRPIFVCHSWKHAAAALLAAREAGRAVMLLSPIGASYTAGVGYWEALQVRARELFPEVDAQIAIDCDDAPGHVLAALRSGLRLAVFEGNDAARARLEDVARACGGAVLRRPPAVLDLLHERLPEAACRARLATPAAAD